MDRRMTAIPAIVLRYLGGAFALALAAVPAYAQQDVSPPPPIDVNAPTLIIEPLPQPRSPVRSASTGKKRGSDSDQVGRDIDAARRRVQSGGIDNEIQVREDAMDRDRVRTERLRAATDDPHEAARLRQEYNQRLAEHERWRDDKERQRQDLEPPPPADDDR